MARTAPPYGQGGIYDTPSNNNISEEIPLKGGFSVKSGGSVENTSILFTTAAGERIDVSSAIKKAEIVFDAETNLPTLKLDVIVKQGEDAIFLEGITTSQTTVESLLDLTNPKDE